MFDPYPELQVPALHAEAPAQAVHVPLEMEHFEHWVVPLL